MATRDPKKTSKPAAKTPAKKAAAKPAAKAPAKKATAKGTKAAPKAEKPARTAAAPVARGPLARLKAAYGSKDDLVKRLVEPLARGDEDTAALSDRLRKASNQQLLRLARVVETVQQKFGGRDKLIQSLAEKSGHAKDKDYIAALERKSLPNLLDQARR